MTAPRREVWLQIALAVAQGMPEPTGFAFNRAGSGIIVLHLATSADAAAWSEWAGAYWSEHGGRYFAHAEDGAKFGYDWQISADREAAPTTAVQALAAEVVAAIESPAAVA